MKRRVAVKVGKIIAELLSVGGCEASHWVIVASVALSTNLSATVRALKSASRLFRIADDTGSVLIICGGNMGSRWQRRSGMFYYCYAKCQCLYTEQRQPPTVLACPSKPRRSNCLVVTQIGQFIFHSDNVQQHTG